MLIFLGLCGAVCACLAAVTWIGGPVNVFESSDSVTIDLASGVIKLVFYGIFAFFFQAAKALYFAETAHVMDLESIKEEDRRVMGKPIAEERSPLQSKMDALRASARRSIIGHRESTSGEHGLKEAADCKDS